MGYELGYFRKRPVVIQAHQWFKNGDHPDDGPAELEGQVVRYFRVPNTGGDQLCAFCGDIMHYHGWVDTLESGHIVCPTDWIITGVHGERYPCKADIFQKTYEPV